MSLAEYIAQKKAKAQQQQITQSYYHAMQRRRQATELSKSQLDPVSFYAQFDIQLKTGGSVWQLVKCPFHDDTKPSMGVNRIHGGYKCHACGESGDMIKFYMTYKGVDFITACHELGLRGEQ